MRRFLGFARNDRIMVFYRNLGVAMPFLYVMLSLSKHRRLLCTALWAALLGSSRRVIICGDPSSPRCFPQDDKIYGVMQWLDGGKGVLCFAILSLSKHRRLLRASSELSQNIADYCPFCPFQCVFYLSNDRRPALSKIKFS